MEFVAAFECFCGVVGDVEFSGCCFAFCALLEEVDELFWLVLGE